MTTLSEKYGAQSGTWQDWQLLQIAPPLSPPVAAAGRPAISYGRRLAGVPAGGKQARPRTWRGRWARCLLRWGQWLYVAGLRLYAEELRRCR